MRQAALFLLRVAALAAQPPKMPTVLYGASYHAADNSGKTIHYDFNYSGTEQKLAYAYAAGSDLLSGA
jgi:hypothetical protein